MKTKIKVTIGIGVALIVLAAVFATNNGFFKGALVPTNACLAPYHSILPDGRCVWSCNATTIPDRTTNECICQSGLVEIGTDQAGRRICGNASQADPDITRAELMDLLIKTTEIPLINPPASPSFRDVPTNHPYYQIIETARAAGLTSGTPQGLFMPNEKTPRASFAALATGAFGLRDIPLSAGYPYLNDKNAVPAWAKEFVGLLYQFGAFDTTFQADKLVTKSYASNVANNLMNRTLKVTRAYLAERTVEALNLNIQPRCRTTNTFNFSDVGINHPSCSKIKAAVEYGIFNNSPNGTFRPDRIATRAEVAFVVARIFNIPEATSGNTFSDVPSGTWFYGAVEALAQRNIIKDYPDVYPDGTFRPSNVATTWFLAHILKKASGE